MGLNLDTEGQFRKKKELKSFWKFSRFLLMASIKMKTRMYSCSSESCFKSFRDLRSLEQHAKVHLSKVVKDPKDFTCSECKRAMSTKQSLKQHRFIHSDKKPYRCSEIKCGRMFKQSSQLCNHRKVHKEAKKMLKSQPKNKQISNFFGKKLTTMTNQVAQQMASETFTEVKLPPLVYSENKITLPKLSSLNST
jgi:Zinc finger, C2H2 type